MATLCGDFGFTYEFGSVKEAVEWYEIYLYEEAVVETMIRASK